MTIRLAAALLGTLLTAACGQGGGASAPDLEACPAPARRDVPGDLSPPHAPASALVVADADDYDATGAFRITLSALSPAEAVAIVVVNATSVDHGTFEVRAQGVSAAAPSFATVESPPSASPAAERDLRGLWRDARARSDARRAALLVSAGTAPTAVGSERVFHVFTDFEPPVQIEVPAVLRVAGDRAYVYVDRDRGDGVGDEALRDLADAWDSSIYPRLRRAFGAEPDADGNGRVIILVSPVVGADGRTEAYFSPFDQYPDPHPTGIRSNEGDVLYLADAGPLARGHLAHELLHMIAFHQRVRERGGPEEEAWVDEGLAMVAMDVAGYGHGTPALDPRIEGYLRSADLYGLTRWEGAASGNYGGSYLFFRHLADRFGEPLLGRLVQTSATGVANVEAATCLPFWQLQLDWRVALAFDHTGVLPPAEYPQYHYATLDLNDYWEAGDPAHVRGYPLASVARARVRADGAVYFFSAPGTGGDATFTVTPLEPGGIRPRLVVVRY